MSPAGIDTTIWLLAAAAALPIGLVLSRYGIWPRRRGETPHCRKCDYNLTGLDSERCPECGTELTETAVVHGERRRRPMLIIAGGVCCGIALGSLVVVAEETDWYRWLPTSWVLGDLQSAKPTVAARAWRELRRREKANQLSASQRSKLIDVCLADQASTKMLGLTVAEVDYLGDCYADGQLSPTQAKTFADQLAVLKLKARPKVVLGDRVPLRVDELARCPSSTVKVALHGEATVLIDGQPIEHRFAFGSVMGRLGTRGSTACWVPCDQPGRHTVAVSVPLKVYTGQVVDPDRPGGCLRYEADVPISATFEVVPADGPSPIKLIKDASLQADVRDAIELVSLKPLVNDPDQIVYEIAFASPPLNVAFDMVARVDGEEHHLATLTMRAGAAMHYQAAAYAPPKETFDLILRSNEQVARRTIDLFEIWDGELVYVSVSVEKPTTQSGSVPKPR